MSLNASLVISNHTIIYLVELSYEKFRVKCSYFIKKKKLL